MKHKKIQYFISLILVVIITSCGGNKSEYFQLILKDESRQLRGVEIGQNIEKVRSIENPNFLKDEMPDYLHYDYTIDMGNTFTVTYDFSDDDKLYEIELAVFLDAVEDAGFLYEDFNNHFTRKFGKGRLADDGFTIWKIQNAKKNIEIAMINDSQSYGYLSVIISDLDY